MSRRLSTAEFPDLLPCGSADTGEAGTVSGQSGQPAPQDKAAGIHPPASPLLGETMLRCSGCPWCLLGTIGLGHCAVDFGTSPHGLSADLPLPVEETQELSPFPPSAKPLLTFTSPASTKGAYGRSVGFRRNTPNVYTSAKANCRSLQVAACAAQPPYYLRLGDREFLQVYSAVEHDRNRTRKAIGKGLCEVGDLRASDPLWQILQDVMTRRMRGYRL